MVEEQYETERKFLVTDPSVIAGHEGDQLRQAYLYRHDGHEGRIRLVRRRTAPGVYENLVPVLTIKGPRRGATRPEYEMEVPISYASELYDAIPSRIQKTRYSIVLGVPWEIDVFEGANQGLVVAEYEAADAALLRPNGPEYNFLGPEVTRDRRYNNEYLAEHPWTEWPDNNLRAGQ